jgi:hypothetical protein
MVFLLGSREIIAEIGVRSIARARSLDELPERPGV